MPRGDIYELQFIIHEQEWSTSLSTTSLARKPPSFSTPRPLQFSLRFNSFTLGQLVGYPIYGL